MTSGAGHDAQMIAQIQEDVETEFGIYHPVPVVFNPQVPVFSLSADFSNVSNNHYLAHGFTSTDSTLLLKNHFTVRHSKYQQFYDVYNESTWDGFPLFITTDAILHIYHVLFDRMMTDLEMAKFYPALQTITEMLLADSQLLYGETQNDWVREAVRRNVAFLGVARRLLNGHAASVPAEVTALVDSELVLIEEAAGYRYSPVLGNFSALDYSQFIPRGHYTRSDSLKQYFKAMMWYGWTIFTMESSLFDNLARRHTLQALLLTQAVHRLSHGDLPLLDLWQTLYQPTVFFADFVFAVELAEAIQPVVYSFFVFHAV